MRAELIRRVKAGALRVAAGLLLGAGLALTPAAAQQTNEVALANQYFQKGDYEKAEAIFEKLADNQQQFGLVYSNYLNTLLALKKYKDAEKLARKAIKIYKSAPAYEIDLGKVYQRSGNQEQAQKQFDRIVAGLNQNSVLPAAAAFEANDLPDYAEKAYLQGRKLAKDETLFAGNLISLYMQQRQTDKLIEEVLSFSRKDPEKLAYAQNMLQNTLREEKEFDALERTLLSRVQKNPEETNYGQLLIWLYTQRKDFFNALLQAKALDKRMRQEGSKVLELGQIALTNHDYEAAVEAFSYLTREYKGAPLYPLARQRLINAREEQVKNTFPIDQAKIRLLIADYEQYLAELGRTYQTAEALKNMAALYAFYLDDRPKAIKLLDELIAMPRANPDLVAQAKLTLGDIYVLKNEPWEATLLYSQVELSHKESPLAHEAKLRNAKLNYYKGDFELAQEHLDVLKLATSREIANDAMDLSILILDNLGLDTTSAAMEDYARTDLLIFQHKYLPALLLLDSMLIRYPGHSLTDEIYYQKAQIYVKMGDYPDAVKELNKLIESPKNDILSDDALFLLAKINEEQLKDVEKAKELYTTLITKHPGSLYVVDARKRFRKLRGDAVAN